MKYTTDKTELLTHLRPILDKYKDICEKERLMHEDMNNFLTKEWEEKQQKGKDLYNTLHKDWWRQFVTIEKVKARDRLFFNERKGSEVFDLKKAEEFLRGFDEEFYIKPYCSYNWEFHSPWYYHTENRSLKVLVTQGYSVSLLEGKIYSDRQRYEVYYANSLHTYDYYPDKNVVLLEQLVSRINNTPEYVKDITLETNEIKTVEYFLSKEGVE